MKVSFIGSGGHGNLSLCKLAIRSGHSVSLFTSTEASINVKGLKIYRLKKNNFSFINFFYQYLQLKELLRSVNPDLVHVCYLTKWSYMIFLLNFRPYVLSTLGSDILNRKDNLITKFLIRKALQNSSSIINNGTDMNEQIMNLGAVKSKIENIYLFGADESLFYKYADNSASPIVNMNSRYVMTLNQYREPYGLEVFIRSIPLVLSKFPNIIFVIISRSGPLEFKIRSIISKLGIEKNIILMNDVEHNEIPKYLNSAEACVFPCKKCGGFPAVIFESLACGCPVIASDTGSYTEIIEDSFNGLIFKPGDFIDLAEKTCTLLSNKSLQKMIVNNSLETISVKGKIEHSATSLNGVYNRIKNSVQNSSYKNK